jgi:hypothetical protein
MSNPACRDLDPDWLKPHGSTERRGPVTCVLYPNCQCGREDGARLTGDAAMQAVDAAFAELDAAEGRLASFRRLAAALDAE